MYTEILCALLVKSVNVAFARLTSDSGSNNGNNNNNNYAKFIETPTISLISDLSVPRFGNSSTSDYFKLLDLDGDYLLIGARDVVYNISVAMFVEVQSVKWPPKQNIVNECLMKGKPKDACHNYVRVLAKDGDNGVLICGTNAFQPMCRKYQREKYGEYRQDLEFSGLGIAPYDPSHNSTFLMDGDLLYAGTVSDFSGADPLIHRRNVSKVVDLGIRTERNDVKFLNEPHFVGSFLDDEHVYIWLREQTMEHEVCGASGIHSRIARLCRSDLGGPRSYSNEWTSFVKARVNCSIPGHYPFYFDQIEAISQPVNGHYSSRNEVFARLVYAVFRSPLAGISSSAVCAFDVQQINNVISESAYGDRNNMQTLWMDIGVSKHRPGKCVNDSRSLSEEEVAFARANPLMNDAVQNYFGAPVAVHSGIDHFTQIAVDAQVKAADGRLYDVIFVGTDQGNIFKMVNLAGTKATMKQPSHHICTFQVTDEPVRNIMLYQGATGLPVERYLIVVSERSVARIPVAQCDIFKSCTSCVALRDPHCAWNLEAKKCVLVNDLDGGYEQDIITGRTEGCGIITELQQFFSFDAAPVISDQEPLQDVSYVLPSSSFATSNSSCICEDKRPIPACASGGPGFSGITSESTSPSSLGSGFSIAVLCASIAALAMLFGFFVGSVYRHCKMPRKEKSSPCPSFSTTPQPVYGPRLSSPSLSIINAYESVPKFSATVLRSDSPISLTVEDLSNSPIWSTSTLPKNYRVKQIYL